MNHARDALLGPLRLRQLRLHIGLTATHVAERAELDRCTLSRFENVRRTPSPQTWERWLSALHSLAQDRKTELQAAEKELEAACALK